MNFTKEKKCNNSKKISDLSVPEFEIKVKIQK